MSLAQSILFAEYKDDIMKAMSIVELFTAVVSVLGPFISSSLILYAGFEKAFVLYAFVYSICSGYLLIKLPSDKLEENDPEKTPLNQKSHNSYSQDLT